MNSLEELINNEPNGSGSTGHRLLGVIFEDVSTRTCLQVSKSAEGLGEGEEGEGSVHCYSAFSGDATGVLNLSHSVGTGSAKHALQSDGFTVTADRSPQHPLLPSVFGGRTQTRDAACSPSTETSRTFPEVFTAPETLHAGIEMCTNNVPRFHLAVKGHQTLQNIAEKMQDSSCGAKTFEWMKVKRNQPRVGKLGTFQNFLQKI